MRWRYFLLRKSCVLLIFRCLTSCSLFASCLPLPLSALESRAYLQHTYYTEQGTELHFMRVIVGVEDMRGQLAKDRPQWTSDFRCG